MNDSLNESKIYSLAEIDALQDEDEFHESLDEISDSSFDFSNNLSIIEKSDQIDQSMINIGDELLDLVSLARENEDPNICKIKKIENFDAGFSCNNITDEDVFNTPRGVIKKECNCYKRDCDQELLTTDGSHVTSTNKTDLKPMNMLTSDRVDDNECQILLDNFVSKNIMPNISKRHELSNYINKQKVNALSQVNHEEAQKLQEVADRLHNCFNKSASIHQYERIIRAIEDKIREIDISLTEVEAKRISLLKKEEENHQQRLNTLKQTQQAEIYRLESKWQDTDLAKGCFNPSQKLDTLENKSCLLIRNNFGSPESNISQVEEVKRDEGSITKTNAQHEMELEYHNIMGRYNLEVTILTELFNKNVQTINLDIDQKIETIKLRKKQLYNELNTLKSGDTSSLPVLQQSLKSTFSGAIISPRTATRINYFRSHSRNPKIIVKPLGSNCTNKFNRPHVEVRSNLR